MLQLPHIVIKRIVGYLDENCDKLSLTLACKQLYEGREGFLLFEIPFQYTAEEFSTRNHFKLNSFQKIALKSVLPDQFKLPINPSIAYSVPRNKHPTTIPIPSLDVKSEDVHYYSTNTVFEVGVIPVGAVRLIFCDEFDQVIIPDSIVNTVKEVVFGEQFNTDVDAYMFPNEIQSIKFGEEFNSNIILSTLKSLKTLVLGKMFDCTIDFLPKGLETLVFGARFNRHMQSLPNSLVTLSLGNSFNKKIANGILPPTLKNLSFGFLYNQPLPNDTLPQLEMLKFGNHFDQAVDTTKYPALKRLILGQEFDKFDSLLNMSSQITLELDYSEEFYFNTDIVTIYRGIRKLPVHINSLVLHCSHSLSFFIRLVSQDAAIVINQYLDGGFLPLSSFTDGTIFKRINELFILEDNVNFKVGK